MQAETELTAAWLAENIMGWPEIPMNVSYDYNGPFPAYHVGYEGVIQVYDERSLSIFSPLNNIADAWKLVEAIEEKPASEWYGYRIDLYRVSSHDEPHRPYACRFFLRGHELFLSMPTAPQAICHAAYAWWLAYGQEHAGREA